MIRLAGALALAVFATDLRAACSEGRATIFGDWGQAGFSVTVADDAAERSRGLMFVEEMATLEGMLFVYERPQAVSFWMKNTLIPLDMIFVAPDGEILKVHQNAVPHDVTAIDGGDGVLVVLEVNGGLSARLGVRAGDTMQHPAFGADAILPCEN